MKTKQLHELVAAFNANARQSIYAIIDKLPKGKGTICFNENLKTEPELELYGIEQDEEGDVYLIDIYGELLSIHEFGVTDLIGVLYRLEGSLFYFESEKRQIAN